MTESYTERFAEYEEQLRAKYNTADRDRMAKSGEAMPDGSYPIADAADLENAIRAVGRGSNNSHAAIRRHIMARAKALKLTYKIPDDWNSNGTLSDAKSEKVPAVARRHWSLKEVEPPIVADLQGRSDDGGTDAVVVGWPSTTGRGYEGSDWLGEYEETINPGAFGKTLKESEYVPLLLDHRGDVMASWNQSSNRTMDLAEDSKGLRQEARLDAVENSTSRTVVSGLRRQDYAKMSFAFRATKEDWNPDYTKRGVNELQLFDVSIVKSPANKATSVMLRSDMIEILGREGVAVIYSARSVLDDLIETRSLDDAAEPLIEQAMRALRAVDERMASNEIYRYAGRARTFVVADLMEQVRSGKVLSAQNEQVLRQALDALSQAGNDIKSVAGTIDETQRAISGVIDVNTPVGLTTDDSVANQAGLDSGPVNNGKSVFGNDGAGVRSIPPSVLKAQRELELIKLRSKRGL